MSSSAPRNSALEQIQLQIMWNRLLSVVEEQAQALLRTAFSTSVREAGDLSAGVFDLEGQMLAQAVTGTPGHVNAMAASVGFFIQHFPVAKMEEGDVYITNDPWMGTGHLNDFTVVTPTFKNGRVVALFASTSHVVDVGGRGFGADGRQVYEEGVHIPMLPLAKRGVMNETLLEIVRSNVRNPIEVEGDLYSLAACNDTGAKRLLDMMAEFALDDVQALGRFVMQRSHAAMLEEIAKIPFGTYENHMRIDGYEKAIDLVARMTVGADGIDIDFAGTSPVSSYGINVPLTYTQAYASFGVRCVVGGAVPNNAGSLGPVRVTAPEGCILNAPRPSAVCARHAVGQMLPDVVLGCLHQAIPDRVPAEGASCLYNPVLLGGHGVVGEADYGDATPFTVGLFHAGGTGARPGKDGLSATAFPSGVRNTPVEINETISPMVIWRKEYRTDSGGAGALRGGLGQVMEFTHGEGAPFAVSPMFDRIKHVPRGRDGGENGHGGRIFHLPEGTSESARAGAGETEMRGMGRQGIPAGERLVIEMPGGGGLGAPKARPAALVARDVRDGLVSAEAALRDYGVAVTADGGVDETVTAEMRGVAAE